MRSVKNYTWKLVTGRYASVIAAVLVIGVVSFSGVHIHEDSHAQSPYASGQADSGSLASPATAGPCVGSSDGNCVQFGSPAAALAVHIDGSRLVNSQGKSIRLLGVDADNTEFCTRHHTVADDNPLNSAEAADIASWNINAVRIPLNEDCWLGINGVTINGETAAASAATYQTAIENWVNDLNGVGIIAILDLQWEGAGSNLAEQQWPMADEDHSPAFWTSVATTFKADPAVMFDVINEPFLERTNVTTSTSPWNCWLNGCSVTFIPTVTSTTPVTYTSAGMQQLVTSVRTTGANQPIILGGLNEAGDPCEIGTNSGANEPTSDKNGSTAACTELANLPSDPDKQLAVDFHNYQYGPCSGTTCWTTTRNALNTGNIPMVTDEFGEEDCSDGFMNTYMNWADQNNVSYLAWSWNVPPASDTTPLSCPAAESTANNFYLLANWSGDPSTVIPQGANYKAHLATVSP